MGLLLEPVSSTLTRGVVVARRRPEPDSRGAGIVRQIRKQNPIMVAKRQVEGFQFAS